MRPDLSKAAMSAEERALRSKAAQILASGALLHGYLAKRTQVCGKPNCKCTRGEKHAVFVLVVRRDGRSEQIPIPKRLEPAVRQWVEQDKTVREIVARISELQTDRLRDLKKLGRGGG
jgi:hypothetical protein